MRLVMYYIWVFYTAPFLSITFIVIGVKAFRELIKSSKKIRQESASDDEYMVKVHKAQIEIMNNYNHEYIKEHLIDASFHKYAISTCVWATLVYLIII
jgi:Co/Zn/Cd efflux system component